MTLVVVDQVSKLFPPAKTAALDTISFSFPKGKLIGLVGPDGAGKTTLVRLIAGLLEPSSGTITVAGYDTIKNAENIHEIIGYMPQKFGLYEDLTVQQNLNLYADLRGVLGAEREERFKTLLHFTSLGPFTARLAGRLSGGMKQKLGLACALIKTPTLLLLDEPSVGVDPLSRRELWKMVQELIREDISVIWSTAYLDEAEKCDEVMLLEQGKLIFSGLPAALTSKEEGKTYLVSGITKSRRVVLENALNQPTVLDGVIQGSDVRLVLKKENELPLVLDGTLQETKPRFEDAYISILGGGPGGISVLAQEMPQLHEDMAAMIEVKNLTKKFGSFTAVDDVSLTIRPGEIFGLLGPNGAGKTTIFKMMCGLLTPTCGTAFVHGVNLQEAPGQARSLLGYMAQKFSLYDNLSVKQNLAFFGGIYNLTGAKKREAIDHMINIFALEPYINQNAGILPLGFKQRLALSCAVMHHPLILFLDEPTSGVDPIVRREFWNHINGLVEKGVTIMITTHFMDEAEYCDRIALVYRGKLIAEADPDTLKAQAKTPEIPSPTLEDAFIQHILAYDAAHPL